MIVKLKKLMTSAAIALLGIVPMAVPAVTHAADLNTNLCAGVNLEAGTDCENNDDAEGEINNILKLVINIFSLVVGVISVIMIIIGGLKYITSGGESSNITGAKNTILYAIIGLVIVALAQVIVRFVLGRVSNTTA
jgi:cytochrome bd-type quinol oxidase subunit 2